MTCPRCHARPRPAGRPRRQPSGWVDTVLVCERCGWVGVQSELGEVREMASKQAYTTQEQLIRACGEGICNVVRTWKPAIATQHCPCCGRKFYHIAEHVDECRKLTPEERWQKWLDETGYRPRQMTLPLEEKK